MRANVMRLWLAIGAVAVVSGCSCNPPTECEDLFVSFDSPKDGAIGVPATTEVTIKVANGAGTAIELDSAQLVTRASAASEFSAPHNGALTAGQATFSGVTLEPGPNVLKVSVKKKGTACTGTKSITVEVPLSNDAPKVLTFAYPQDTAMPTGVLNSTELPSAADLRIDLTTQFAIGGSVQIFNEANNQPVGNAFTVVNSAVSVQIPAAALADNGYTFFAKVTKGTLTNTATGNPEAVKSITLARTAPTCAVTLPNKAILGPNDDADSVKAGYQLRLSGTAGTLASTIELKLSGGAVPATSGPQPLVSGGLSRDFDVPNAGSTLYTVTVEAKDAQGNVCLATRQVTVDFDPPTCVITSPTAAGSPYATFNIPLSATTVGGNGGTVSFQTSAPQMRDLSAPLAVANETSAAFTAAFTAGAQVVTATCTDAAGNSASTTQSITVNGAGCSIFFVRPATKPALITTASYNFLVQTSCPGQSVTLKQSGGVANKTANADGSGIAAFSVTGLTNGLFTFTAEVGAPASSDSVEVTVDLNAPVITRPLLAAGKAYALLNVAGDLAPGSAGAQTQLAYAATVPTGGRVDVCTNQVPPPAIATGPCADNVAGWSTLRTGAAANEPMFNFPEGTYAIKIVVVVGTTAQAVSEPVAVVVDVTAPVLTNVKFVRDANSDKALNIAELGAMPIQVSFDLGAGNPASSIALVEVRDTVAYNTPTSFNSAGQVFTVTLNQNLTAPVESDFSWTVEATDVNLNKGTIAFANVRIDQVAPTCVITQPSASLLGGPDDAAPAAGFQLNQQVTTSLDVVAPSVTLGGGQTGNGSPAAVGGVAAHSWTLTQTTGVQTYNFGASCTDVALNVTVAAPRTGVSVDLEPPTCTITAPTASPPQYLNFSVPTSVTVTGAASPDAVRVYSQPTAGARVLRANLPISGGFASGSVSYTGGVQAVTAEVDDLAGNVGACGPVSIDVNGSGCDIAFTSPVLVNGTAFLTAVPFTVAGHTSNCGAGLSVTLFDVVGTTTTQLGTGTTNASGDVTVNGTLAQGGPYKLRLQIDNGGGILNFTDLTPVRVDSIAPLVGSAAPTGATLNFVAATNSNLPGAAYVSDLTSGGNADFTVSVNNITGALNGTVKVFFKGVQVGATVNIMADPQPLVSFNTSLPHNDTGAFEIQVADEAGNVTKPTVSVATIDVIAPAAPTVTLNRTDARAATIALSWGPTYDDGAVAASGAHAGYDIRWSTDAVTGANQLATSANYFNSAHANPEALELWAAGTINKNLTLPPFNTYYIVVRARDELGNYSPYVAPTGFDNNGTKDGLVNPTGIGAQSFGRLLSANGSLNGDTIDDLVTNAVTVNTVYVYFGRSGFGPLTTCAAPNCQSIALPVTPASDNFGADFSVGNVGDTTAPDLLVASPNFSTNTGRVFLFFGGANPIDTATFIEFRGPTTGVFFGRTAQVLPDINQDGIGEIAIMDNENAGRARVYIYKGRSKAAWQTAATGGFVPTTLADAVIEGPSPITGNTFFGFARGGYTSMGDLNADGNLDFTIPDPKDNINKLFIFSGATVAAATIAIPLTTGITPGIASNTLQELTTTGAGSGSASGFSVRAIGGRNFIGASGNDLLVSQPQQQRVLLYSDITLPIMSQNVTISGANNFGSGGALGSFRSSATTDLVISENSALATSNVWVFYARQGSFDNAAGGGFWQSLITGPASGTTGVFGSSVATGDFDNDSKADVAMSDPSTTFGRVLVWH